MSLMSRGFTLMELLIVVAITLILSGVGLSNFMFSLKKSHDAQRKSDLATIAKGIEAFTNDFGTYPSGDAAGKMIACQYGMGSLTACGWGSPLAAYYNGAVQTYLAKIPTDPVAGQNYYYEKSAAGFNLYAALENTADPYYKTGLTQSCGTGVTCSYQITESGAK